MRVHLELFLISLLIAAAAPSCNEYEDPPPASPTVPDVPPTQFDITGRWDGMTDQGRPLRFDVNPTANVVGTTITIHHDCSGGRLVLRLGGYGTRVNSDGFSRTLNWRRQHDGGKWYVGTLTVSGTFLGNRNASGSFINSVTEKQVDELGVCGPSSGTWQATRAD